MDVSGCKILLGVTVVLIGFSSLTTGEPRDSLTGSDVSDFIDLDDPFYDTSLEIKEKTTKNNVNIDAVVSEKPIVASGSGQELVEDDSDQEEISGAGSGSGMEADTEVNQLNITTLPKPDETILSTKSPTETNTTMTASTASTTTAATLAKTVTETLNRKETTVTYELPKTSPLLPTSPVLEAVDEDEDERDDGAADDSVFDWAVREGGEDESEEPLFETTSLRPSTPSTAPATTKISPTEPEVKTMPYIPDILQEAGAGDGSPCDDVTCLYGGICRADGDDVSCSCPMNCSGRETEPVCGSDGEWYRNQCELQQEACRSQQNLVTTEVDNCQNQMSGIPMCPEDNAKALWGSWSPWVASGDVDFRFRSCDIEGHSLGKMRTCRGPRVEVRSCNVRDKGTCKMWNGTSSGKFSYRCDGVDVRDIENAEMTFGAAANGGDFCRYSLYDLKRKKLVFSKFNLSQVVSKGHIRRWCSKEEAFLVSYTPLHVCKRHLMDICKSSRKCKGSKLARRQRNLGDFAHGCWKNFILGNRIPSGMSDIHSTFTFLCQRFSPDSRWGKIFGHKRTYFGTIYDTAKKIPVASLAKVTRLGEDTWPKTEFMIETGLIDEPLTFSWLFKKEKGMSTMADGQKCQANWDCGFGMKQALPLDYDMSGYRIAHIMWPELIGHEIEAKLSTFSLTNAAPMHPSLYSAWRHSVGEIRSYALNLCKIPLESSPMMISDSELYLASGTVPSSDPATTIGNDVNVPFLFWMAACCVRDDGVQAFAIYARNIGDSPVIVAPILQLESLLQDIYKVRPKNISLRIFPAGEEACGELRNDVSRSINI